MANRVIWQDIYALQVTVASTTLAVHTAALADDSEPSFDAVDVGIQLNTFALPLTDHANLKAPSGTIDSEQARGISPRHQREFNTVQTGEPAEYTLPLDGHAYNISAILPLFFQSGSSEAAATVTAANNVLTNIPYVIADTDMWAYITRHLQPTAGSGEIDQVTAGTLASSLTFAGETGGILTMEAVMKAAAWDQKDLSGVVANVENSFDLERSLKYQDSIIAGLDVYSLSLDLTDLTFDQAGKTIVSSTDFAAAGYGDGDYIMIKGSNLNDGIYLVATVATVTITLDAGETLQDEGTADAVATVAQAVWIDIKSPSISFTAINNVTFNFYNDDVAVSAHMGRLGLEGSITIPYSQATLGVGQSANDENYMIRRFLDGDTLLIAWYWGVGDVASWTAFDSDKVFADYKLDPATDALDGYKNDAAATDPDNYFSIVANVRVNDYEMAGDNELMTECTLMGVTDSVANAIEVYTQYNGAKLNRLT